MGLNKLAGGIWYVGGRLSDVWLRRRARAGLLCYSAVASDLAKKVLAFWQKL